MNKIKLIAKVLRYWGKATFSYFRLGIRKRSFLGFLITYIRCLLQHLYAFSQEIEKIETPFEQGDKEKIKLELVKLKKLKNLTSGLHQLLPATESYFYSFLICIDEPHPAHLKHTLNSLMDLSAPNFEVLLGIAKSQKAQIQLILDLFVNENPKKINIHNFEKENLNRSAILNKLTHKIKGNYLFIMKPGESVRTDLLYRYEQTLRFYSPKEQERIVLYCDENILNDEFQPKTSIYKPEKPYFPYYFNDYLGSTLLIPKSLWIGIDGFREELDGAEDFDLPLRLDIAGAQFIKVPVALYSSLKKTTRNIENYSEEQICMLVQKSYENYWQKTGLDWQWNLGHSLQNPRAMPLIKDIPKVHVVIPYKDQENLTLDAIAAITKQEGVLVRITAVDNNSANPKIAEKLKNIGVEVIQVNEPYNFSRLNNIAINQSNISDDYDKILFLNNDVELEEFALLEMCRWISQPKVGLVGCKLNYPNGLLQHGGIELDFKTPAPANYKNWFHPELGKETKNLTKTNSIRIVPAVTGACCLVKKDIYKKIGGFDEIWYPVAYSDTSLAAKIKSLGLFCLYTPFACGVHHESISRTKNNIEDYESTDWVYKQFSKQILKNKDIPFQELEFISY